MIFIFTSFDEMVQCGMSQYSTRTTPDQEDSVKNHTDVLIFHTAICAGASQIALMADEKSPSRISPRVSSRKALRHGGNNVC